MCGMCFTIFVSQEFSDQNLRMPKETQSRERLKDRKVKPEFIPIFDVWRK